MMSETVVCQSAAAGGDGSPQTSTVGGSKPLHRFIRAQPKCVGIVLLFLGGSFFILGIPLKQDVSAQTSANLLTPFWLGILFIVCGILFVLTETSPSKKMVTISLALSIISILAVIVAFFQFLHSILINRYRYHQHQHNMVISCLESVFMVHSVVGGVILIVMTAMSRAALHSSRTQAVVVMHNLPSAE